ncbi:zinc-dependent alcohol dehydrogenase [Paenibacillus cymbidii]|uniref:zinc-dependent alcohol dehydrogenase n=1 Tax=Paenibacillus cymbidii TaxID=1639034 RepID=UPI0010810EDA|nr:zinc-binding alcohol dehydrogenase [Paenibacillus cymbidii]
MSDKQSTVSNRKVRFTAPYELAYESEELSPSAIGSRQVLVKTSRSLFSPGTELALYTGTHVGLADPANTFAKYPFYPGYASVGEVIAAGGEAGGVQPGDIVYSDGRHAAYYVQNVHERSILHRVPDGVLPERAVFARLAAISAASVVQAQVKLGTKVAVYGMGLVGNLAAQLFGLLGAEVAAIDPVPMRLGVAKACGIPHAVNNDGGADVKEQLRAIWGAEPDIVVEATGVPELVNSAMELVRIHGQVVLLGSTRGMLTTDVYKLLFCKCISVVGAHESGQGRHGLPTRHDITRYVLRMIAQGALRTDPLLTHTLPAERADEAYELLLHRKNEALGVQLKWD